MTIPRPVPSITDFVTEALAAGVTTCTVTLTRDTQTELPMLRIVGIREDAGVASTPRIFAAEGDYLLPMDGMQTFSEAIMRSGMTDAQKIHWLLITLQEYEAKGLTLSPQEPTP